MKLNELIRHPAQLKKVDLICLECKKTEKYNSENSEVKISVTISSKDVTQNEGNAIVDMMLTGEGFTIHVIEKGEFSFELHQEENIIKKFVETQGVKLIWSYLREVIYDVSGRMLGQPILLPTIDVMETISRALEE